MYFASRPAAGKLLADQLVPKYRYENCAVVALSDGGVIVGAQIAAYLHCVLTLLLFEEIHLPSEPDPIAGISQPGAFTYNNMYSTGEIEEAAEEFRNYLDQQRFEKMHEMNHLLGDSGIIRRDLLYGQNVILVSDGLVNGFSLDVAAEYLKPIKIAKLIVATPLATVTAVDRMHVLADEVCVLSVQDQFDLGIDHYYDQPKITDHEVILKTIENMVLNWK